MENTNLCKLCNEKEAKYICPRCNIPYCSLTCYQCQVHVQCSESFYRDCVVEQIKNNDLDPQSQHKMMEMLQRVQQIDEHFDSDEVPDSDDDASEEELAARLSGVDLDDADSVWAKLTAEEKRQFEELLRSGDVSEIVPQWKPWWLYKEEQKLVEDLENPSTSPAIPPGCPDLFPNIQPLSSLSKTSPSPSIRWNVVNLLAAYSLTARLYNGDHLSFPKEAATTLVSLSDNLSTNQVFDSPETAIAAVHLASVVTNCMINGVDEGQLKDDVEKLVEGPSDSHQNVYVLAALSDIQNLLLKAKQEVKGKYKAKVQGEFSKRFPDVGRVPHKTITVNELNKQLKKLEFYLSWTNEYF